jgi:hypothetical protein
MDTEQAWWARSSILKTGRHLDLVAQSLAGLDSQQAWDMRDDLERAGTGKAAIAEGLIGVEDSQAWMEREDLENDGSRNHFIMVAMVLKNQKLRHEKSWSSEAEESLMDGVQQELLDELNLIHRPTLDGIKSYFWTRQDSLGLEKSPTRAMAARLSQAIQDVPEAFLKTIAAKRDRNPEMLAQRLFEKIYPDTVKPKNIGLTTRIASFFGFGERPSLPGIDSVLTSEATTTLEGAGESLDKDTRTAVEFRNQVPGLLAQNVYGSYDKQSGTWHAAEFPLADTLGEPTRQTTGTITGVKNVLYARLPKPLSAKVLPERVKGVMTNGTEVPLEVRTDHLGLAMVVNDKGADKILYSIEYETAPLPMRDLSAKEYSGFAKRFESSHGKIMREALPDLPEEIIGHIQTTEFKSLTPKEQVEDIENFVREVGYYDTNNQETLAAKQGKKLEDKFFLAEARILELRANGTPGLENKKIAGVCADYASITSALLRKAGFLSGVVTGLNAEGKEAKMRDAHATAYVVWPTQSNENHIVIVDGTPASSLPEFAFATGPTIAEREHTAQVEATEAVAKAKTELAQITEILNTKDDQAIKKLSNGKLERALNTILHHEVTDLHTDVLKEMLNVYWYGGLNKMEGIQSDLELRKTMEDVLDARRVALAGRGKTTGGAGTELFEAVQDFIRKYKKAEGVKDSGPALDTLDRIGGIAIQALQPTEQQALDVIITYLRAKKVG